MPEGAQEPQWAGEAGCRGIKAEQSDQERLRASEPGPWVSDGRAGAAAELGSAEPCVGLPPVCGIARQWCTWSIGFPFLCPLNPLFQMVFTGACGHISCDFLQYLYLITVNVSAWGCKCKGFGASERGYCSLFRHNVLGITSIDGVYSCLCVAWSPHGSAAFLLLHYRHCLLFKDCFGLSNPPHRCASTTHGR